jgi:hypothetical protein
MEMSIGWQELGVVDTIYEDDHEEEEEDDDDHEGQEEERFDSPTGTMSSSPPTSRSSSPEVEDAAAAAEAHPSSLPPALRRAVQAWYVRAAMRVAQCDSRFREIMMTSLIDRRPCRCRENGSRKPDVVVRVQEHRLPLHRVTSDSSPSPRPLLLMHDYHPSPVLRLRWVIQHAQLQKFPPLDFS